MKNFFQLLLTQKNILYFIFLVITVSIIYRNHFDNDFQFDDGHTIQNNLYIQNIKNIPLFFKDATTFSSLPANQVYRPVVTTSLAIDYWLGNGYNLFYFHLSSFILFLFQGILMYFFYGHIANISHKNTWNHYIPIIAVACYLLHPVSAETINYISARSDLQSTFFVILGFILYMYSPFCKKNYLYLLPIGIGAMAKPTTIMFAPMFFFYVLLFEENMSLLQIFQKNHFPHLWSVIKRSLPAFLFCVFMYLFTSYMNSPTFYIEDIPRWQYLITQVYIHFYYFTALFLPIHLNADTDWALLDNIWDIHFLIGIAFILTMLYTAFICSKEAKYRPISFGILWFFLALIPTSSIIPLSEVMNDHRMFFPFVGLMLSVCWAISMYLLKYNHLAKIYLVGIFLILAGLGYGTFQRNEVWHSQSSLWKDVTIKSPNNARGWMNYGRSQMALNHNKEAERSFQKALKIAPNYAYINLNMAVFQEKMGDLVNAEKYYKNALANGRIYPDVWYHYGSFLNRMGRYDEAIVHLNEVLKLSSAYQLARYDLMSIYQGNSQWDKLQALAESTLKLQPNDATAKLYLSASKQKTGKIERLLADITQNPTPEKYLDLSLLYSRAEQHEASIDAAQKAITLKPNYAEAYNNICYAYLSLQKYEQAIAAGEKAIQLKPDFELAKNNLKAAKSYKDALTATGENGKNQATPAFLLEQSLKYYNQGLFEKCIETCNQALTIKPDYAEAYSNICAAYIQLKQYDKAIAACNHALRIAPQYELAKNNLNWAKREKAKPAN